MTEPTIRDKQEQLIVNLVYNMHALAAHDFLSHSFTTQGPPNNSESFYKIRVRGNDLQKFFDELLNSINNYVNDRDYKKFKTEFEKTMDSPLAQVAKDTRYEKIVFAVSMAFKNLFNFLDLGKRIGRQSMEQTYNPVAKQLLDRNHFLATPKSRSVEFSKRFEEAFQSLELLEKESQSLNNDNDANSLLNTSNVK